MKALRLCVVLCLSLLFSLLSFAQISSTRLGDGTGEDWEPAILAADGSYVYALWPHFGPTTYKDTSGATCMPFSTKVRTGYTTAYMYFQMSNGGSWSNVVIPRCPVHGNVVDAQLAIGANHRIYAGYMDGNSQYTPIMVIHSDDHGSTWSAPVDVTGGHNGDKDIVLADQNNNVIVAFENGGRQYISVSTNGGTSFSAKQVNIAPSGVALATGGVIDTQGNAYIAWSGTDNKGKGPTTFYVQHSNNLFSTYAVTTADEGEGEPVVSGAGWDYWGGSVQIATQPRTPPVNDRVIVVYNAGAGSNGAPERIYTKYSDTLGATWNIPFNSSSWPNGSQLSLAPSGVWHAFPSIAASASVVKAIWMDNRATPGGNYTCTSSSITGACGVWNVYERSSADGATNWSSELVMTQATPYRDYQTAAGFDHPYGDYSETVTDGVGNFYAIWAEGESYLGSGDVYYAKS
ncbi:MAG TPA: sialidase family protein [Candidatus Dormibacteraeota bacterium]|nr:sialidase family protein [Candidatus Dormibacteraeota bacterium]